MTLHLDIAAVSILIRENGVEAALTQLAEYIEQDYRRWPEFEVSPRSACHSPLGVLELMPIADHSLYSFKHVNGHPANAAKGLLTVYAFGVLSDVATGTPLLLADMTLLTALRTAATAAVAGRALTRKNSRVMAMIGCGSQAEFQILAFKALLGIAEVRVFDIAPAAMDKLTQNLAASGLTIIAAASVREAVKGADIVTTATAAKTKQAVITPDMLEPGMHINGIGGDCPGKTELHPDVLRAARVVVEYEKQTRHEGDIQQLPADFPVTELWRILTGVEPGRQGEGEITVFDSVGFAIEDFSALRFIRDLAKGHEIGRAIELMPELSDPRDLYRLVKA